MERFFWSFDGWRLPPTETLSHDSSEYILLFPVKLEFRSLHCCIFKERIVWLHFQSLSFKDVALGFTLGHDILNSYEENK